MNINQPVQGRAFAIPFTRAADPNAELTDQELRLPFLKKLPDSMRNHFVAMCGEYVGTVLFLWFALSGTQVANSIPSTGGQTVAEAGANPQQLQYIALCFGFSLAVNAWVFFRISGGLFNPAVTLGMCLIGALPWVRGLLLFFVQILGGITAAALVTCMFPHQGKINVRTSLGGGTSVTQGLFIEMFLTAQLVFTIFMLAAEKHKGTFIAPVGIGLALLIAELTGVYYTGGSLNPARSFGPAVVNHTFNQYHWIYWLGPILGAILAAGFYKFIKILEYETANPGQDSDHAANVERRKNLLLAAGINEYDASKVAEELTEKTAVAQAGGPDGTLVANGQGRRSQEVDRQGIYGTQFRHNSTHSKHGSDGSDLTYPPPQRPLATTTGSQIGRFSYLGERGVAPGNPAHVNALAAETRMDSPAMTTNDQLYAPLAYGADVPLGGSVHPDNEPRQRFGRTSSSYA
ncbi:Aquaporin-1 [Ascochyta rabiei]|uniref:Transporter n=1 Tax=Didymella rabiei TaxID=5454 RepID=A0A163CEK1_DIDRA|nr:Aquaporin-1 [Ascochyta rabiei]KZM22405.1 transporter [Ascochyta rabiei]UPX09352.1 Aquaporin-1 [Ascochyta rabiei]